MIWIFLKYLFPRVEPEHKLHFRYTICHPKVEGLDRISRLMTNV